MNKFFLYLMIGCSVISAEYIRDDSIGVVTDRQNGLMWQDNSTAATDKVSWYKAVERCEVLKLGGYDDWRLPERDELDSLADENRFKHGIYPVFENVGSGGYWSKTVDPIHHDRAWMTLYTCGGGYWYGKYIRGFVRCVRDMQSFEK